ncbi:hypothetical protein OIU84_002782, partial [Salix udensis]
MSFCIMPEVELTMTVPKVELRSSCSVNLWAQAKIVCEVKGMERLSLEEWSPRRGRNSVPGIKDWPPRRSGNIVLAGRRGRNTLKWYVAVQNFTLSLCIPSS